MSAMTQPSVARRLDRKVLPYGKFCSNPAVGFDPYGSYYPVTDIDSLRRNGGATVIEHLPLSARSPRLQQLDRILERDPEAIAARRERAGLLREQDAYEEAKRDYLELIRLRPTDFGVLNDFGTLVLKAGYRDAARSLFDEAVRHHPDNPNGHVNLANL
jgi:tetratricopeptide (TPR) repeat protein